MSEGTKVPDTPRAEFFENAIREGNEDAPLVVQVSSSGQLVHILTVDTKGAIKTQHRRLGVDSDDISNLVGRLLTHADSAFSDPEQRKAYKDMTRQHVRDWLAMLENSAMANAGIDGWVGMPFSRGISGQPPDQIRA